MLEFRMLGPVEIAVDGRPVPLGPPKRRAVLAVLMAEAARPVTVQTLVDRVWEQDAGEGVRSTLYSHVTHLRTVIADAAAAGGVAAGVRRESGGYVLRAEPDAIDLRRYRRLAELARTGSASPAARAAILKDALDLWRGEPLTGVAGAWAENLRHALAAQRIALLTVWAEQEIDLGQHEVVIDKVAAALADQPLAEPLVAVHMRALVLTGRPAQALAQYAATRARLAEELGTEPCQDLRRLHETILRDGPKGRPPVRSSPASPRVLAVPAQLPPEVFGFAGRRDELHRLDKIASSAGGQPTAVVISAVSGTAGVGKTALAVHWAQQAADRFPDGQLYVNLRGFDPSGTVMSVAEAVRVFLDAFEVPGDRVPAGLPAQINLYRSLLATRRALVVLDNARDAEQVRPLLPGAPGCLVVVTSRNSLTGLVAAEGAQPLEVDLLAADEARQLLSRRLGAERVAAELDAVHEIVTLCAGLPLALAIVAARAISWPAPPLRELATELRQAQARLEPFASDDSATDVRALFSWSYQALTPAAARLFRLLGLHAGPDVDVHAAASIAGIPVPATRPLLADLSEAHLLTRSATGRYGFHDLLRAYAAELTQRLDSDQARHGAVHRMLDNYLHTAIACDRVLSPLRDPIVIAPAQLGTTIEPVTGYDAAMSWFTNEHTVLLATIGSAAANGFDTHAVQLPWAVMNFFDRRGHWHDWITTQRTALTCAQRTGDPLHQAIAHRALGRAYTLVHRHDDASSHLNAALTAYREIEDHAGQAHTHLNLNILAGQRGDHPDAHAHAERALHLFRRIDHLIGQAHALNAVGWTHAQLGNHIQALDHCRQAVSLHRRFGNHHNEALALDSLGYTHHHLGQHQQAIACYQRALDIYGQLNSRYYAAETLVRLADTHEAAGAASAAHAARQRALDILDDLGHSDADQLRARTNKRPG